MRGVKGKPKKRKPIRLDDPAQSARFIAAAKKLGLGKKPDDFEKAVDAVFNPKPKG